MSWRGNDDTCHVLLLINCTLADRPRRLRLTLEVKQRDAKASQDRTSRKHENPGRITCAGQLSGAVRAPLPENAALEFHGRHGGSRRIPLGRGIPLAW